MITSLTVLVLHVKMANAQSSVQNCDGAETLTEYKFYKITA